MPPDRPHITGMKRTVTIIALGLGLGLTAPAGAQEVQPTPEAPEQDGGGMMEQGFGLLLRGLLKEVEPALNEMERAMKEVEPLARQLSALLGDARHYEPPERLPNGDILIRRKPGAPPPPGLETEPEPPPDIEL